jgi:hypothetical protein
MLLSTADRLVLLSILPQEGNITDLKIIRKIKDDLSFDEGEHKICNFRNEDDQVKWEAGVPDKDVTFGEKATDIIAEAFKRLNAQKKLREEHVPLYDKFVTV